MKVLVNVHATKVTMAIYVMSAQTDFLKIIKMILMLLAQHVISPVNQPAGRRGQRGVTSVKRVGLLQKQTDVRILMNV